MPDTKKDDMKLRVQYFRQTERDVLSMVLSSTYFDLFKHSDKHWSMVAEYFTHE